MRARAQAGVSLVEVMVVTFIVGLLIALAVPGFQAWIQNTQIRTASESIMNGLQTARNEAIRRNTCMQIKVSNEDKTSWTINPCSDAEADPPFLRRSHEEGSVNVSTQRIPPNSDTVSFNALGRLVNPNPSDGTAPLTQITVRNLTMTGDQAAEERMLRIDIPVGGSIRLCDPAPSVALDDPRRCT
jgi:type IV fimbrial biogenesis protein FimT